MTLNAEEILLDVAAVVRHAQERAERSMRERREREQLGLAFVGLNTTPTAKQESH